MSLDDLEFHKRWTQAIGFSGPQLRIPYRFIQGELGFADSAEDLIREALDVITKDIGGCIQFYDDTATHNYHDKYIQFQHLLPDGTPNGCNSHLGMVTAHWGTPNDEGGRFQTINLGTGCLSHRTVQHEMYHALGFMHEQNRNDQATDIVVHFENIDPSNHVWFSPMGDTWWDIGERYEIDSIMQYYGYSFSTNGEVTISRVDNGEPVWPRSFKDQRPTSVDIIQLRIMYEQVCPVAPNTLPCDNGDYYLEDRECDGLFDCVDNSDEGIGHCGSNHCAEQIIISSDLGTDLEGLYIIMDAYIEGKVAYQKSGESFILSYNEDTVSWNIKDADTILAWGLNYDGVCPQGSDETWHIEPIQPYTGFTMTSGLFQISDKIIMLYLLEYEPLPTPPPSGRCELATEFVRYCSASWHQVLFTLSAETCLRLCSDVYTECVVANHYPSFQLYGTGDRRTNCWLWGADATSCSWGIPGATLIQCTETGNTKI